MEPALPVGSIVFTRNEKTYSHGDIITFETTGPDNLVTHRITDVLMKDGQVVYQTKGDANEEIDAAVVPANKVIGKSILALPYVGYFANFVRTPRGFVIFVVIPAAIIVYEELKAMFNELKRLIFKNKDNAKKTTAAAIIIPFMGGVFMLVSTTGSLFQDQEKSNTNVISAADSYDEETPTPIPTPSESTPLLTEDTPLPEETLEPLP